MQHAVTVAQFTQRVKQEKREATDAANSLQLQLLAVQSQGCVLHVMISHDLPKDPKDAKHAQWTSNFRTCTIACPSLADCPAITVRTCI
jgi:hypothetical protein